MQRKFKTKPVIYSLSLGSSVKSKHWSGPNPNTVTVTLQQTDRQHRQQYVDSRRHLDLDYAHINVQHAVK